MAKFRPIIVSIISAAIGAALGWFAKQWLHQEDFQELAEKRERDAKMKAFYADTDRRHQAWWDNLPTEKRIQIEMRRAELSNWEPPDDWKFDDLIDDDEVDDE